MDPITLGIVAVAAFVAYKIRQRPKAADTVAAPPQNFAPPKPKTSGQDALKTKACAAADTYVALMMKAGLPPPPGWGGLNCDQKIAAVATLASGGSIPIMAGQAAVAEIVVNYQSAQRGVSHAGQAAHDAYTSAVHKLGF